MSKKNSDIFVGHPVLMAPIDFTDDQNTTCELFDATFTHKYQNTQQG